MVGCEGVRILPFNHRGATRHVCGFENVHVDGAGFRRCDVVAFAPAAHAVLTAVGEHLHLILALGIQPAERHCVGTACDGLPRVVGGVNDIDTEPVKFQGRPVRAVEVTDGDVALLSGVCAQVGHVCCEFLLGAIRFWGYCFADQYGGEVRRDVCARGGEIDGEMLFVSRLLVTAQPNLQESLKINQRGNNPVVRIRVPECTVFGTHTTVLRSLFVKVAGISPIEGPVPIVPVVVQIVCGPVKRAFVFKCYFVFKIFIEGCACFPIPYRIVIPVS